MINIDWLDIVVQVAIVMALVNLVKKISGDKLGQYAMLVSMGIAFVVVFLASMPSPVIWFELVRNSIIVGLTASGLFDLRAGK